MVGICLTFLETAKIMSKVVLPFYIPTIHVYRICGRTYSNLLFNYFLELFAFLLLNFEYSLYVLDTSPLLDTLSANIVAQFVICLYILLTLFQSEHF